MSRSKVLYIIGLLMVSIGTSLVAMQNFAMGVFLFISAIVVLLFAVVIGAKEKRQAKK